VVTVWILVHLFADETLRKNATQALEAADFYWLLSAGAAAAVSEGLCSTRWWLILRSFGMPLKWREALAFSAIGLFYSLGLPGSAGGDAMRTLYLIRMFPDKKLASAFSVLSDRLCGLVALIAALCVTLALRHSLFLSGQTGCRIVLAAFVLLAGILFMLGLWWGTSVSVLGDFLKRRHTWLGPHLLESGEIFNQIGRHPAAMLVGVGLSALSLAAHFLCYFFSACAFGATLNLGQMFSVMPLVDTLTMIPVALYGVGLREALFTTLLGDFFNIPAATATLLSLGGFGAQASVALTGAIFLPFVNFLASGNQRPDSRPVSLTGETP